MRYLENAKVEAKILAPGRRMNPRALEIQMLETSLPPYDGSGSGDLKLHFLVGAGPQMSLTHPPGTIETGKGWGRGCQKKM